MTKEKLYSLGFIYFVCIISLFIGMLIGVLIGVIITVEKVNIVEKECVQYQQKINVVCDNQNIWDNRGKIRSFKCECDNIGCRTFPSKRICVAGIWLFENNQSRFIEETITCTEIKA